MSTNYKLVCKETNEGVWIGQGFSTMTTLYSDEEETMEKLRRFLVDTKGKSVVLMSEYDDGYYEVKDYNKFNCKVCTHCNFFIDKGFCGSTEHPITLEEFKSEVVPNWCPIKGPLS